MLDLGILATIITPYLSVIPPIVILYRILTKKIPMVVNPINIALILLFFWSIFSGIINKSLLSSVASIYFLLLLSINVYLEATIFEEASVEKFIKKVWKYSMYAGILGIIEKVFSFFVDMTWISDLFYKGPYVPTVKNYRIYSTFGNPNIAGAWFAAMVILGLYLFERSKNKEKVSFLLGTLVFILALLSTGSKGATLGLMIAILVYGMFKSSRKSRIIVICAFGLILILALISPEINHTVNSRNAIWLKSLDLFYKKPITGWGIFGIVENIKKTHAHNIWISMLSMFGTIGFLLYMWLKAYVFKGLYILYKYESQYLPLLAGIQALVIGHGIVDFAIMAPQAGILFMACSSIIVSLANTYQRVEAK